MTLALLVLLPLLGAVGALALSLAVQRWVAPLV